MTVEVEHPDIKYVVYPVHRDGTLTGQPPRMRHYDDCGHFDWGDGKFLGTPVPATDEQMKALKACKSCVECGPGFSTAGTTPRSREGKHGQPCPTCHQVMPLTGVCDDCG